MSDLRILVVEDDQDWQDELQKNLRRIGTHVHIDAASIYQDALNFIGKYEYDLITVDLIIDTLETTEIPHAQSGYRRGMELLQIIRANEYNKHCALIVLTGHGTISLTNTAQRDYDVYKLVEKEDFSYLHIPFTEVARAAIREARLKKTSIKMSQHWHLTFIFMTPQFLRCELVSPDQSASYETISADPLHTRSYDYIRRGDNLNLLLLRGELGTWRPDARALGKDIYDTLCSEPGIARAFAIAEAQSRQFGELWLQFCAMPLQLGVPFELLHNGADYLARSHLLTRRVIRNGPSSRGALPFYKFLADLLKRAIRPRILIVGANSDGNIPEAENEAERLKATIESDLNELAIASSIDLLIGKDASYDNVSDALRNGHYHIFHYAGHGLYNDKLPEISGLILRDTIGYRTLTSHELNTLMRRNTDLQLAFLSCCFSARNSAQIGNGDFHGMLDAIASTGIPNVIGYRWTLTGDPALSLAQHFYKMLWRSFSPADALLEARERAMINPQGLNDETWMSPVLIIQ